MGNAGTIIIIPGNLPRIIDPDAHSTLRSCWVVDGDVAAVCVNEGAVNASGSIPRPARNLATVVDTDWADGVQVCNRVGEIRVGPVLVPHKSRGACAGAIPSCYITVVVDSLDDGAAG